jgi:hypothetical protein
MKLEFQSTAPNARDAPPGEIKKFLKGNGYEVRP